MDWKRERDGLTVVGGIALVIGIVVAGAPLVRFASTLLAAFLGGLLALWVGGRTGEEKTQATGAPSAVPTGREAGASGGERTERDGADVAPPSGARGADGPAGSDAPVDGPDDESAASDGPDDRA